MCGEGRCGEGACGNMTLDMEGMVMNANKDNLPRDCREISEDVEISVSAGKKYAAPYPDTAFGFDQHQWQVEPCSRITVTYTNEDDVRHQWMVHGLPAYLYPQSMFHLEANGGYSKTGTFIVPSDHKTYLVHCDMATHMEKGMKAQLVRRQRQRRHTRYSRAYRGAKPQPVRRGQRYLELAPWHCYRYHLLHGSCKVFIAAVREPVCAW